MHSLSCLLCRRVHACSEHVGRSVPDDVPSLRMPGARGRSCLVAVCDERRDSRLETRERGRRVGGGCEGDGLRDLAGAVCGARRGVVLVGVMLMSDV